MSSLATYTRIGVEPDANSIRQQFAAANGWENQYRLIIQLGKLLPALPMLGLARSQFALNLHAEARQTLDALIAANPTFRSSDGHLLYARCLEASGDTAAAIHEYEALVEGFLGEEARVRFGLLLKREGRAAQATDVFNTVLKRSRVAPAYYQREQREWIEIANREAAASPG